ncbi:MAG: hypothetical protein HY052_02270 [Proteobacteria bacterium]|nr:hypothetical protein [Pseudomonadota bacterium]
MPKHSQQAQPFDKFETAKKINTLTLAFAKAVAQNQADKSDNLVVSPYNALTCLSMVAEGAAGNTRQEMAHTLFDAGSKNLDKEVADLAQLNTDILAANQGQVELKTANGVWTNKELMTLNQKYATDLQKIFGAQISEEDFSDPTVPGKINAWAAQNTNNLIPAIVDRLDASDSSVSASALYFKGKWTHQFDKKETEERGFTADGGAESLTPTMHKFFKEDQIQYQNGTDYEAVALTYGQESDEKSPTMRLVLVRPKDESISARDWLTQQAGDAAPAWLKTHYSGSVQGTVELPRLDIKQKHDLIPALKDMGIRDAFTSAADFSPMTAQSAKLCISGVSHDVVFKTDEEGSEAAAVTTVRMRFTSVAPSPQTIDVKFDRSFVFALQDISSGAVIFAGAVNKPNGDMKPAAKGPKPGI